MKKTFHWKRKTFSTTSEIYSGESVIGRLKENSWMTKAHIQISEHSYHWKYDNRWNTRWSLSDSGGVFMICHGSSSRGAIEFDHDDDLLLLTGLFVTNYYSQMAIVIMVAILIPIFASVSTQF